jgi:hypothetical protein
MSTKKTKEIMIRDDTIGDFAVGFLTPTKVGQLNGTLSSIPFSFSFQDNIEAGLLCMFDEFNSLVGKDDLFRKTVKLIRAWWMNESITYVGVSIKQYLSNAAFLVLISSVFNKYHSVLHTPLQAFTFLFAEFSTWQPTYQLVTLHGFVELQEGGVVSTSFQERPLVTETFVAQYRQLLNISDRYSPSDHSFFVGKKSICF